MQINVITTDGSPRNQELKQLSQLNLITGIDGRTGDYKIPGLINQEFNLRVLGSMLSESQAAAVLSHRIAQTTFDGEWCCVLEDDAVILDIPKFYESLNDIDKLRLKKPAIILLYMGFGGVLGKTLRIGKNFSVAYVFSPPTGAVAYALNNSAKELINSKNSITGVPDWPTWVSNIDMYALAPNVVSHDPGVISLYSANMNENFSTFWPKYRKLSTKSFFGFFDKDITDAHGGKKNYYRLITKTAIHRGVSQIRSRIRLR